jgi:hypothetical protein
MNLNENNWIFDKTIWRYVLLVGGFLLIYSWASKDSFTAVCISFFLYVILLGGLELLLRGIWDGAKQMNQQEKQDDK